MAAQNPSYDPLRSAKDLRARIDKLTAGLFLGFMGVIDHGVVERTDYNTTSQNQYQLQIDTAKLIRTAEDILTLTRQMQELWLQGHLKPPREEGKDEELAGDVKAVAGMLDALIRRRDGIPTAAIEADGDGGMAMEM